MCLIECCTGWSKSLCAPDDYNTDNTISQHTSFLSHYLAQSDCLAADRQGQRDTRRTVTPSVIPNCNCFIMVNYWNCLKYFCVFFVLKSLGAQRLFDHPVLSSHLCVDLSCGLSMLTLCRSYLNPYCLGRKTVFFQWAFKFTCKTRNRYPLKGKNYNN
jgi:hypothetical protein